MTSCRHNPLLLFRQFGAQKASNGSVTFFVGFATKNVRQNSATSPTTSAIPVVTTTMTSDGALQMTVVHRDIFGIILILAVAWIVLQ